MATLPAEALNRIRQIYANNEHLMGPDQGKGDLKIACYNWASTGILPLAQMVRPQILCDYVSREALNTQLHNAGVQNLGTFYLDRRNNDLNATERGWLGITANRQKLDVVKNTWNTSAQDAAAVLVASKAVAKLAIEANGLNVAPGATSYKIAVYYYNYETMPSFQHWWIEIEGVWFELFPGLHDIQVARDAQHLGGNKVDFFHHVTALHQSQADRIMRTLGWAWQPDNAVTHCPLCNSKFTKLRWRHHCRKCGKVVCSSCSSHTKLLAWVISRPE